MSQSLKYHVDLVICIDATGSMSDIINRVKDRALSFHTDLMEELKNAGKHVDALRIKVVAFRDYYHDANTAMNESVFFTLPEQVIEFKAFLDDIEADGGGDEPENGLEARALAINSDWTKNGDKRRHLVVMWTDASAHPLEKVGKDSNYPINMPKNFDEMTELWGQSIGQRAKRLILFAPAVQPWSEMPLHWDSAIQYPSKGGEGLADMEYKEILNTITKSI